MDESPRLHEIARSAAGLRRLRPLLRMLAAPGIVTLTSSIFQCPPATIRWFGRTGFDHLVGVLAARPERAPSSWADLARLLDEANPPPPPDVRALLARMQRWDHPGFARRGVASAAPAAAHRCPGCGGPFAADAGARWCSPACAVRAYRSAQERDGGGGPSTGDTR